MNEQTSDTPETPDTSSANNQEPVQNESGSTPAGSEPATQTTGGETEQSKQETPAEEKKEPEAPVKMVTLTATGSVKGTVQVAEGTKVKDALKMIDADVTVSTLQIRDTLGGAVGIDRQLKENLKVSITKKSAGS